MLRFATPADTPALLAIYAQYIETPVTFEYTLPTEAEFRRRIENISADYPYLIWEEDGRVLGYAYAHRHMEREAYQWNAELSIYLDRGAHSRGLGTRLYTALIDILRLQGVRNVYGCITLPNDKSTGLHESMGFSRCCVYHSAGYKCGKWHDVCWYEKAIAPYDSPPAPFCSIRALSAGRLESLLQ